MKKAVIVACLTLGIGCASAYAHHSFAMFDMSKIETAQGTVKDFQYRNPHSWIDVVVIAGDGSEIAMGLEGYSPAMLSRRGWTKDTLTPGMKIGFTYFPNRNGTPGGAVRTVTLPDGTEMKSYDHPAKDAPAADLTK